MRRLVFFLTLFMFIIIFNACSIEPNYNNCDSNSNSDNNNSNSNETSNILTSEEISTIYTGVQYAKSYILSNISYLQKNGIISHSTSITSEVFTFKKDHECYLQTTSEINSLTIEKRAVFTKSRQGTNMYEIIGNLTINDKSYSISYEDSFGVPSLIINGVKVY